MSRACDRHRRSLSPWLDGGLAPAERRAVEEHLRHCLPCNRERRSLERLRELARRAPAELAPEGDLWPGIASRLRPAPGRRRRRSIPSAAWLRAAILAGVAVLAGWLLWRGGPGPTRPGTGGLAAGRVAAERAAAGVGHAHADLVAAAAVVGEEAPEAAAALAEGLAALDRAEAELLAAREAYPDERRLGLLLGQAYRREGAWAARLARL